MKSLVKAFAISLVSTMGVAIGNHLAPIIIDKTSKLIKNVTNK